jgi:hypothetical protein
MGSVFATDIHGEQRNPGAELLQRRPGDKDGWGRTPSPAKFAGLGALTPRPHIKDKPFRSLQSRADYARGGIGGFTSAPTARGAPCLPDRRLLMQAEELHQSYASRVGSHTVARPVRRCSFLGHSV